MLLFLTSLLATTTVPTNVIAKQTHVRNVIRNTEKNFHFIPCS